MKQTAQIEDRSKDKETIKRSELTNHELSLGELDGSVDQPAVVDPMTKWKELIKGTVVVLYREHTAHEDSMLRMHSFDSHWAIGMGMVEGVYRALNHVALRIY